MRRALIAALLAVGASLALAAPAQAHNVLVSSEPAKNAQLDVAPNKVELVFDQSIQPGDVNQVAVTGPGGTLWTDSPVQVDANRVSTAVRPLGPKGQYTVGYRVVSADGHPVSGQLTFVLTKAGFGEPVDRKPTGSPAASEQGEQSETDSGGVPLWVWLIGAAGLLGAGLFVALRLGKEPS